MDLVLWIAQLLLAGVLVAVGSAHLTGRDPGTPMTAWMRAVPRPLMATIGALELAAAGGLLLPAITRIVPVLTPIAAAAIAVLMLLAVAFHARRPGEAPNIAFNVVLAAVAAFIAYGRFVAAPLA